jgi:hypothetical protein
MNQIFKKILVIATAMVGCGQLIFIKSADSVPSVPATAIQNKDSSPSTDSQTINPVVIDKLSTALSKLEQTINTGQGFDYWPDGGMQIAYYHLATFVSYKTISQLSPEPVYLSGPHGKNNLNVSSSQTFGHYNPKFLQWLQDHLLEILQDKHFVKSTRENFQTYLGRTVQTYWATYMILNQHPHELNTLLDDYEQRLKDRTVPDDYYYNIAWQENSDQYDSLRELSASYDMNVVAPAVYFWLRRRLDGTDTQVFSMVEYLLNTYQVEQSTGLDHDLEELPLPDE